MTPGDMSGAGDTTDRAALIAALRAEVDGEIRFDAGSRGACATDGSNYRQVPLGVVVPHAHAAAAVPGLRHLEWFHDHVRIERLLFDGVLDPGGGSITPGADGAPGLGLTLAEERAEPYRVE